MRFFGYVLFISGTILFGIMHLAISLYIPDVGHWSGPPSLIGTVLSDIAGWVPYILSIVFMVIGIIFIIYNFISSSEWGQKQKEERKARDREFREFKASLGENKNK